MRKLFVLFTALCALTIMAPAAQSAPLPGAKYDYKLKDVFQVAGCDGKYLYVSCSKALYKYDMQGKFIAENFMDGVGKDIQIAVHDAETLAFKRTFKFNEESGQEKVSGITVAPVRKSVWMCSWVGEESGRYLYEYDLNGMYLRKVHLQSVPQWMQGVFGWNGSLFLTADDGTADENESDHLYRVDISSNTRATVVMEKEFNEVLREGEIEGLCVDPNNGDLLVYFNRGAQIVLGMNKGLYPGYTEEIHEVYRYAMIPGGRDAQPALMGAPAAKPAPKK